METKKEKAFREKYNGIKPCKPLPCPEKINKCPINCSSECDGMAKRFRRLCSVCKWKFTQIPDPHGWARGRLR